MKRAIDKSLKGAFLGSLVLCSAYEMRDEITPPSMMLTVAELASLPINGVTQAISFANFAFNYGERKILGPLGSVEKAAAINQARLHFRQVEGNWLPIEHAAYIPGDLAYAGVDYDALDPDGKKSAVEMREELARNLKDVCTKNARARFGELQSTTIPGLVALELEECLTATGLGHDILDETGASRDADMRKAVVAGIAGAHIREARADFNRIADSDIPNVYWIDLNMELLMAGTGYAALDETGQKTGAQMWEATKQQKQTSIRNQARGYRID